MVALGALFLGYPFECSAAPIDRNTRFDGRLEVLDDDGKLRCSVRVEFSDSSAADAKILVECRDNKLAADVHAMLQNAAHAASSVKTGS
mgnify:CR=1 FL=1